MKLAYTPSEKNRRNGNVRVQMKNFDGVLKVRKWNYRTRRWGKWAIYAN